MRKAILPLLIIITMVLSASVATARDFAATGPIAASGGWTATGDWQQRIEDGTFTESVATASHPVATGASGKFDLMGKFRITDLRNEVKIGLVAGGHEYAIEYKNNTFWFNGTQLGAYPSGLAATSTFYPHIYSTDGKVWHAVIYGYTADVTVTAPPTAVTLGLKDNTGSLKASPVFFVPLVFESQGEPAAPPVTTPAAGESPMYDPQQVQDFYNNVYPLIGSPYDTVTRNTDGTYTMTKGYPTSSTHYVAGTVTSAADGSPIAGASVVLGNTLQKTDSIGKFKFEGIANGAADIAVSADGFASKTQSVNVNADQLLNFALDKVAAGGSTVANAENETANVTAGTNMTADTNATMPANATIEPTMAPTMAPTTAPSPTQTQSPGFEGIAAAIAMIGSAGVLVYLNRKR